MKFPVKSVRLPSHVWNRNSPKTCQSGLICSRYRNAGWIHQLPLPSPLVVARRTGAWNCNRNDTIRFCVKMNAYLPPKLTSLRPAAFALTSGLRYRIGILKNAENRCVNAYSAGRQFLVIDLLLRQRRADGVGLRAEAPALRVEHVAAVRAVVVVPGVVPDAGHRDRSGVLDVPVQPDGRAGAGAAAEVAEVRRAPHGALAPGPPGLARRPGHRLPGHRTRRRWRAGRARVTAIEQRALSEAGRRRDRVRGGGSAGCAPISARPGGAGSWAVASPDV